MSTLLIVDDSPIFQRIIEHLLKNHFKIVGNAYNGDEGYEKFKSLKPQIVLLDITMPNCSGKECLQSIIATNPSATVIMVSALDDEETAKSCLALGAKGFIKKEHIRSGDDPNNSALLRAIHEMIPKAVFLEAK